MLGTNKRPCEKNADKDMTGNVSRKGANKQTNCRQDEAG